MWKYIKTRRGTSKTVSRFCTFVPFGIVLLGRFSVWRRMEGLPVGWSRAKMSLIVVFCFPPGQTPRFSSFTSTELILVKSKETKYKLQGWKDLTLWGRSHPESCTQLIRHFWSWGLLMCENDHHRERWHKVNSRIKTNVTTTNVGEP